MKPIGSALACGIGMLVFSMCDAASAPTLSITAEGKIRFASVTGAGYQLLASEDLVAWTPLGPAVQSTNTTVEIPVDLSERSRRFFRVQVLSAAPAESFNRGLQIQQAPLWAGEGLLELGIEAVSLASQLGSGGVQLIVNGTVKREGEQWLYEPAPADRLVLMFLGNVFSFWFEELQGDFTQQSVSGFLSQAHGVVMSGENIAQGISLSVASILAGAQESFRVAGRMREADGREITVEVTKTGVRNASVEVSSLSYDAERRIEGTIVGEEFSMTLGATELYKLRYVTDFVENSTRSYNHAWQSGGNSFQIDGALIRTALRNNHVVDLDSFWRAEGRILLNGAAYGTFGLGLDNPGAVSIRVTYPEGTQEIESYLR